MRTRAGHPARASRRGVTFLESVLGVVLLALVTASLAGAVSFMQASHARLAQRLGAAELANRLILQFIDDDQSLPSPSLPVEYGRHLYRWSMEKSGVRFRPRTPLNAAPAQPAGAFGGVSLDRIQMVTVRVWLAPDSGGSYAYDPAVPGIVVTRLIDPLAMSNPDSLQTLLESPDGFERLMNQLMQLEQGGAGAQPPQGGPP